MPYERSILFFETIIALHAGNRLVFFCSSLQTTLRRLMVFFFFTPCAWLILRGLRHFLDGYKNAKGWDPSPSADFSQTFQPDPKIGTFLPLSPFLLNCRPSGFLKSGRVPVLRFFTADKNVLVSFTTSRNPGGFLNPLLFFW